MRNVIKGSERWKGGEKDCIPAMGGVGAASEGRRSK